MDTKQKQPTMPAQLAIDGKVISIEKIGEKTQAQFAAQLKQNGIVLDDERLQSVYETFHGMAVAAAEQAAKEIEDVKPVNEEE